MEPSRVALGEPPRPGAFQWSLPELDTCSFAPRGACESISQGKNSRGGRGGEREWNGEGGRSRSVWLGERMLGATGCHVQHGPARAKSADPALRGVE